MKLLNYQFFVMIAKRSGWLRLLCIILKFLTPWIFFSWSLQSVEEEKQPCTVFHLLGNGHKKSKTTVPEFIVITEQNNINTDDLATNVQQAPETTALSEEERNLLEMEIKQLETITERKKETMDDGFLDDARTDLADVRNRG